VHGRHVTLDSTAVVELTPTLLAGEHDASVGDQVAAETRNVVKAALAQVALMRTRVAHVHATNVLLQIGLLGEATRALGALVALGSRVGVHVTLEHFALGEGQFALGALEGFQARMDDHVALEGAGAGKLQRAARTLQRTAFAALQALDVDVVMPRQQFLRGKGHWAQMALERLHCVRYPPGFWLGANGGLLEHQLTRSFSFDRRLLITFQGLLFLKFRRLLL